LGRTDQPAIHPYQRIMARLTLLGGTFAQDDAGESVQGRLAQRHSLALLALLAIERVAVSRDKLVAYLWPGKDEAAARHRLSVAMHVIRHSLGPDVLLVRGDAVALDPGGWDVDAWRFRDLLAGGELEAAIAYSGTLLDGFFLRDAPQFERWVDTQRDRFARQRVAALQALALEAQGRGNWLDAASHQRELVSLDPSSASYTLALMHCLTESGQHAAAIRTARAYTVTLSADYGLLPDPVVAKWAAGLIGGNPRRSRAVDAG
jgi:DNA-binding SARP family transcriptional activator